MLLPKINLRCVYQLKKPTTSVNLKGSLLLSTRRGHHFCQPERVTASVNSKGSPLLSTWKGHCFYELEGATTSVNLKGSLLLSTQRGHHFCQPERVIASVQPKGGGGITLDNQKSCKEADIIDYFTEIWLKRVMLIRKFK